MSSAKTPVFHIRAAHLDEVATAVPSMNVLLEPLFGLWRAQLQRNTRQRVGLSLHDAVASAEWSQSQLRR